MRGLKRGSNISVLGPRPIRSLSRLAQGHPRHTGEHVSRGASQGDCWHILKFFPGISCKEASPHPRITTIQEYLKGHCYFPCKSDARQRAKEQKRKKGQTQSVKTLRTRMVHLEKPKNTRRWNPTASDLLELSLGVSQGLEKMLY